MSSMVCKNDTLHVISSRVSLKTMNKQSKTMLQPPILSTETHFLFFFFSILHVPFVLMCTNCRHKSIVSKVIASQITHCMDQKYAFRVIGNHSSSRTVERLSDQISRLDKVHDSCRVCVCSYDRPSVKKC